jgi:hypothetical protein
VLSNERFTATFFTHTNIIEKASRILGLSVNTKIIIVLRNQIDAIRSQYRDHPFYPVGDKYITGRPVTIEEWIALDREDKGKSFIQSLNYYDIVRYYVESFGRENVLVFFLMNLWTHHKCFHK